MARDDPDGGDPTPSIAGRSRSIMVGDIDGGAGDTRREGGDSPGRRDIYSGERLGTSQKSQRQARNAAHRSLHARSDEEALAECVADGGLNAFGCVFVEVWALSDDGTKLTRPDGGNWMDPAFAQSLPSEKLIEKAWELDMEASDCPPGADLAGTMADEGGLSNRNILWRQIVSMLNDPFVQRGTGRRMERLVEIGIGLVGAVPFNFQDEKGIVLFYARATAKVELLRAASNERYMLSSTDLIGANYAIRKARKVSSDMRRDMFREAIKKVKKEILRDQKKSFSAMILDTDAMDKLREEAEREAAQSQLVQDLQRPHNFAVKFAKGAYKFGKQILKTVNNSRRKWKGAKLHGPPRQSVSDCLFCFIGSFLAMLAILKISKSIRVDGDFNYDPGWYTSTLCIIFALTPAPVGQPRQIIAAHLWCMGVGMACRQIPTGGFGDFMEWSDASPDAMFGMPLIYVQALAVALGISGQAFIGILHPPATGMAMTFASKPQWTGTTVVAVMVTDVFVIVMSMMYLNLSPKKQWPLYWLGLGWEGGGGTLGFVRGRARTARRSVHGARKKSGDDAV